MNPCILVFGMPRSGTTWIGKLFDSHPDTLYRHEPDSVQQLGMPLYPDIQDAPKYSDALHRFVESLPRMRSPEVVGKQPLFSKSYESWFGLCAYRSSVLAAKLASRARRHFPCAYRPTGEKAPQARIVWKSIESVGRLGVCTAALPSARTIHVLRHPCGYAASVFRGEAHHEFVGSTRAADEHWVLRELLATTAGARCGPELSDLARLSPEERLAWRWVLTNEKVIADAARCDRVLTVRYEDVCAAPLEATRRMFEFAGLDWNAQTEMFVAASTRGDVGGYYSVFKDPQASAEGWRAQLAPAVQERILAVLRGSGLQKFYDVGVPAPVVSREVVA